MSRRRSAAVVVAASLLVASAACSRDKGSDEAFCKEVKRTPTLESVVSGFADADPEELDTRLAAARSSYDRLRGSAPGAVRDDVDAVADLADEVIDAVADHHDDPEAVAEQLRTAVARHEGAAASSEAVVTYARRTCGIDLNPVVGDGG